MLAIPNYTKELLIFSFTSEHTSTMTLLQKNEEGFEKPKAFFSKRLGDAELRCDILEKKAYAMVKALKDFNTYVLHSKIITYIPTSVVKEILVQPDSETDQASQRSRPGEIVSRIKFQVTRDKSLGIT